MIIKDILTEGKAIKQIEIRTNYPEYYTNKDWMGLLGGYCSYDGKNLISKDGDDYYLEDEIYGFLYESEDSLIIWIKSTYLSEE